MNQWHSSHFKTLYLTFGFKVFGFTFSFFSIASIFCVAEQDYLSTQLRIQDLFSKFESSVVRVKATREEVIKGKTKRLLKMGSGFFVSKDGHILTTGLLANADRTWIEHNKEYFLTENLGSDPLCNLTLLKTIEKPKKFNFVSFSNNQTDTQVGSFLLGLTCALEFEIGPTLGLMQSRESDFGRTLFPTKMIRSSLALGPGEVGGPVFDLNGEFVGITHAALPDLGASFILPAKACARIRDGLILSGKVDYGWFGITVTRKLNAKNGFNIEIKSVGTNSKLKIGDILLKIGKTEIFERGDIVESTFYARPGTFVEFLIDRDGKEMVIPTRVSPRPKPSNTSQLEISDADQNQTELSVLPSAVIKADSLDSKKSSGQ
jgi:S1-C subfamily serine protease